MKKWILTTFAIVGLLVTSCQEGASSKVKKENVEAAVNDSADKADAPIMQFDKVIHDFGTINEGDKVQTTFSFTNTGKSDLIIVDARGSCGCTVPSYPKNVPIAPGDSGEILVNFDSSNKPNMQQKTVTIAANTQSGRETLRIKAMVTPKAK
ncbi:MAG: DUF1573 domain-containing protein [Flavobacteriaceae bacterium]|nr:DUF1573 domain-containing protein [Flavobacteriaceae bacterium]